MRLDEIAHFIALGAPFSYVLLFTFYQIPYILPIAIPISCLIASFILIQRLSSTHELTALRACGFALKDILTPILLIAAFLTLVNFWLASELATRSHLTTSQLKSELRSINPLLLLHNKHLMRLKGIYFEALGASRVGEFTSDVVLAVPNSSRQRLNLLVAKNLKASPSIFIGQNVTLLSASPGSKKEDFDSLLIENIEESTTEIADFSKLLQNKTWTVNSDYLKISLLLVRIQEQRQALRSARANLEFDRHQVKQLKSQLNRSLSDIIRRFSIAFAVFSFTFMGASFGVTIGRRKKNKSLYLAIGLTMIYLIAFFAAKGADYNWTSAAALYMTPHFLIILAALNILKRATKGIE